jgi:endonuclease YncB( thermonuclease family)
LTANWAFVLLLAAPLLGVGGAWIWHIQTAQPQSLNDHTSSSSEQYRVSFGRCSGPIRINCVVDGDTFWLKGSKYRIADINAPEVSNPGCSAEAALGERATSRLVDLLNSGGFSLRDTDRDEDKYGRKLRIVTRGGQSLGATLVSEGLAEVWNGRRRNWC